jgi:transcriptional regulator with XRE-family HTH domain
MVEISPEEWEWLSKYREVPGDLASAVREYRDEQGLSRTALAEKCGASRNWPCLIERGLNADKTMLNKYRRFMSIISL